MSRTKRKETDGKPKEDNKERKMSHNKRRTARREPQLNRDHYGVCYVIVDDDGEPLSDWIFDDLDRAKQIRDGRAAWAHCRIFACGYRTFAEEPEVADDARLTPRTSWPTNCLEGISCPKCGQNDLFRIHGSSVFTVIDEGTVSHGDVDWDDDSQALCAVCEHEGPLGTFRT